MYDKSLVTISQIISSAQNLFVNNSYDDITMQRIAQEANVTKGAIYHHFSGKEDLYLKMMIRYLEDLRDQLRQAVESSGPTKERLHQLTFLYLENPILFQRTIQLVRRDSNRFTGEKREALINAYQEALPNQIEAIVTDGIAAGEIKAGDARLYAWQYVAIVEVSLSDYARKRFDSPQKMAGYLTEIFFNGVAGVAVATSAEIDDPPTVPDIG